MADSNLTEAERRFLAELEARGVAYMIVGLTAATLQGANTNHRRHRSDGSSPPEICGSAKP